MSRILKIRVFTPGNDESEVFGHRPPAGAHFTRQGIRKLLSNMWNDLEAWWPEYDYKLVALGGNCFNFVCIGERAPAGPIPPRELPEPAHA